ncbi:hypothetical protein BC830DRAFT_1175314 [Chytriomyces sp. MP71]|nr:hypothetical protein BC830DRAFT_1175314 [Chytriomyces sp. MP71]
MAKKKKPAPSSRGFATTSVQSKAQTQTKDQAETEPDSEAGADVAVPVLSQELEAEAVQEAETSANDNETNALLPVFSTVKAKVDAETASASAILSRSVGDSVPWLRLDSATENSIFQALAKAGFGQKWDVLETSTDPGSPSPSSLRDFSILLHARLSLEAIGFSSQHAEQALTQIVQGI